MAGLEHYRMALDPAIQKLGNMTTNRHKYFRWTPRTARITFIYAILVPTIAGIVAYKTDAKWDFRAKRKGDLVSEF
ncbi:NADH:ubiquinone oxidoreductase 6.6kD subunit [Jackrogersella minutella]|nr:NADH:ubiquinone oxidoreductase 6.6kD subunit [Jackrogersella minutella]